MNRYIRDLKEGDLEYLAQHLRDADREEVLAASDDVLGALRESADLSYYVKIIDASGKPMGIFGIADFSSERQAIWMVATDEILEHSQKLARYSKVMIRRLFEISGAEQFVNYTYAKNTLHHRWLKWCGAVLGTVPVTVGLKGKEFLPFVIERNTHV